MVRRAACALSVDREPDVQGNQSSTPGIPGDPLGLAAHRMVERLPLDCEAILSAGDGILCPVCSGATGVSNSRPGKGRIRRYRRCLDRGCPGRIATIELAEDVVSPEFVLVPKLVLRRLRKLVSQICSPSVVRETPCASPEESAIPVIE